MESELSLQRGKVDCFKGNLDQYFDLLHVLVQYAQSGGFKN